MILKHASNIIDKKDNQKKEILHFEETINVLNDGFDIKNTKVLNLTLCLRYLHYFHIVITFLLVVPSTTVRRQRVKVLVFRETKQEEYDSNYHLCIRLRQLAVLFELSYLDARLKTIIDHSI